MPGNSEQVVEHLFRTEYGKLVSTITRVFGAAYIQQAEDIVQETLISAMDNWSIEGVPSNPTGWLVQVAKRKVLNELKRNKMMQSHHQRTVFQQKAQSEIGIIFLDNEIEDSQLRMVFTCCHPSLSVESQIALTLKTLCGFGVKEVANALLSTESTINKRLYRAKDGIRKSNIPFNIPQGKDLDARLETVSLTLYLLFNEGYNTTLGDAVIQKELCLEAIRLTKLMADHFTENKKLYALLALMCLHTARFDARIDDHGAIVLFEDQDRTLWNRELINIGMSYLKKSIHGKSLSAFHIEAHIAAEHCLATSFKTTNWPNIYNQYLLLEKLKPNPIIKLNLAIIYSEIKGIEASLSMLEELSKSETLKNYHLLPVTQGVFHMKLKNYEIAIKYFESALRHNTSTVQKKIITDKISKCKSLLSVR